MTFYVDESQQLVLSFFHGVDLLGRGFEEEGFCVVRAGEIDLGFDVRDLHVPAGKFDGMIAGSPCNDWSLANRTKRTYHGYGRDMLKEFSRVVTEGMPDWFLLENVPTVPDIHIGGYTMQRFDLNARDCGLDQNRPRHFQFGSRRGTQLFIDRAQSRENVDRCVTATEGMRDKNRRSFTRFCELQGLPVDFDLPYFRLTQKYRVVGQAVPVPMARIIAAAIHNAVVKNLQGNHILCVCKCGRAVTGKATLATAACRKRMQRRREKSAGRVTDFAPGPVTFPESFVTEDLMC